MPLPWMEENSWMVGDLRDKRCLIWTEKGDSVTADRESAQDALGASAYMLAAVRLFQPEVCLDQVDTASLHCSSHREHNVKKTPQSSEFRAVHAFCLLK